LCYENLVTSGAVLTFGKTCLGAGCCNCCINNLGVTESSNGFLCYLKGATAAVLAFGKTGFGAGRSYCFINYVVVTKAGNELLSNDNCLTYGAVRTLS
jgi:hypothetical protein